MPEGLIDRHSRVLVRRLLGKFGGQLIAGAEVGVWDGQNARHLLASVPGLDLLMVDPYVPYEDGDATERADSEFRSADAMNAARLSAMAVVADYAERSGLAVETSSQVASTFARFKNFQQFDFVFIDAHHGYESVRLDIALWWRQVARGGVLCGHNYQRHRKRGVKQAVDEFIAREEMDLQLPGASVWWVDKP